MKTLAGDSCIWETCVYDGWTDDVIDEPTNYGAVKDLMTVLFPFYDIPVYKSLYAEERMGLLTQILTFSSRRVHVTET